jgi:hypothetical protein
MRFIEPKVDQYLFFNNRPLGAFSAVPRLW